MYYETHTFVFLVVVGFGLLQVFSYSQNPNYQLVVVMLTLSVLYIVNMQIRQEQGKEQEVTNHFTTIEENTAKSGQMYKNIVELDSIKPIMKHIRNHRDFMVIANRLKPFHIFDEGINASVINLLNLFLKHYDNILLDKADCSNYMHMLDIRNEMLNQVSFLEFNTPAEKLGVVVKLLKDLQSKTEQCLRVVAKKCGDRIHDFPRDALDKSKSKHELF
jgi:hypothetical protein